LIDPFTVNAVLSTDAKTYGAHYAQQLSQVALGLSAGMTVPSTTLVDYPSTPGIRGSQIPLYSLVLFYASLLLFAICVLYVGLYGNTSGPILKDGQSRNVHAVTLAQMRLINPGSIIYEMFCASRRNDGRSGYDDVAELLRGSGGDDRITVGVVDQLSPGRPGPEKHFGISHATTCGLETLGGSTIL
jgi:hypothetical protein